MPTRWVWVRGLGGLDGLDHYIFARGNRSIVEKLSHLLPRCKSRRETLNLCRDERFKQLTQMIGFSTKALDDPHQEYLYKVRDSWVD